MLSVRILTFMMTESLPSIASGDRIKRIWDMDRYGILFLLLLACHLQVYVNYELRVTVTVGVGENNFS